MSSKSPICRICLQEFKAGSDEVSSETRTALKEIFDIDASGYQICVSCNKELLTFHKFYLKVKENEKSNESYKKKLENDSFKDESDGFEQDFDDEPLRSSLGLEDVDVKQDSYEEKSIVPSDINTKEKRVKNRKRKTLKKYACKKIHLCTTCGKSYSDFYYLQRHMKQHELPPKKSPKPTHLICDMCGLQKTDRNKMRSHIETVHLKLKDATCHICGADFHHTTIRQHIKKMHRDDKKREKCDECGKFFLDLKQHIARNHNEQEAVFCQLCTKPFKNRMLLALHRFKRHPPDGKYDCRECGKKFTNPVGLKEHKFAYHAGVFLYNCEFCDYRGSYKKNLFDHWKRNHREYYDQRRQLFQARHDTEVPPKIE